MKKLMALLLCLLALCMVSTAMADYNPGDTVTVTVSITSASKPAGQIAVKASDPSVLIFQNASVTMSGLGMSTAPTADGKSFALMSADFMSPLPTGTVGTVTYKISTNAKPGTYQITVSGTNVSASGSKTVTVVIPPALCTPGMMAA